MAISEETLREYLKKFMEDSLKNFLLETMKEIMQAVLKKLQETFGNFKITVKISDEIAGRVHEYMYEVPEKKLGKVSEENP